QRRRPQRRPRRRPRNRPRKGRRGRGAPRVRRARRDPNPSTTRPTTPGGGSGDVRSPLRCHPSYNPPNASPVFGGPMAHILVVEDDRAIAELVQLYLRREGHAVQIIDNGAAALRHVEANSATIDLVVLDLMLPGLDGRGVCRRLRAAS